MRRIHFHSSKHRSQIFLLIVLGACARPASEERNLEAQTLFEVGVSQMEEKNYADAINNLESALTMRPDSPEVEMNLGLAYLGARSSENAIKHIERACSLNENMASCWNNLSVAYIAAGRHKDAIAAAKKAESFLGFNSRELALGNQGDALFHLGNLKASKKALISAVKLNPQHCRNRALLSRTLLQLTDFDNTRQQALLIRKFCPAESRILLWEAYLSYRLGFVQEARDAFEYLISNFSDKHVIEEAQKLLRLLNSERSLTPPEF